MGKEKIGKWDNNIFSINNFAHHSTSKFDTGLVIEPHEHAERQTRDIIVPL